MCNSCNSFYIKDYQSFKVKASDILSELILNKNDRKMIQLIDKQTTVNSWLFAGTGCFDEFGEFTDGKHIGCYEYKIEYQDFIQGNNHFILMGKIKNSRQINF